MASGLGTREWRIHFFQRSSSDDSSETVPALVFVESLPTRVRAEVHAVLEAVAKAPPPAFSGGGKWEAMHGDMAGIYEVRVQGGGKNHRVLCLLVREAPDLGGPSIVCLGGLSKPRREAAKPKDYRRILTYRQEFLEHRTVVS